MFWLLIAGLVLFIIVSIALAVLLFPVKICAESSRSGKILSGNIAISWLTFRIRYSLKDSQIEFFLFSRKIIKQKLKESEKPGIREERQISEAVAPSGTLKKSKIPSEELILITKMVQILEIILDLTDARMGLEY